MRHTFLPKSGSSNLYQENFPTFGVVYLILFIFLQFVAAGLRVAKILLMTDELKFNENLAVIIIHAQASMIDMVMCIGNILANLHCGPYLTCVLQECLRLVTTCPLCSIATTGLFDLGTRKMLYLLGQLCGVFSAFGVSCLPNFIGDQFSIVNYMIFSKFQALFYLIFMALGIFTAPHLIQYFHCFWTDTCYTAVWFADWFLSFVTLLIYLSLYKIIQIRKPKQSVVCMLIKLAHDAKKRKRQARERGNLRKLSLLDYSKKYTPEFRKDAKVLWSMWMFYFPLAGYWALHSQHMTTWILQAKHLNGSLFQLSTVLPNEICGIVPLFGLFIRIILEPMLKNFRYPLRAAVFSQVIMALAFILAAILEKFITDNEPQSIHMAWAIPQFLLVSISDIFLILSYREFVIQEIPIRMRVVTQTLFIMSRSFGNAIVVIVNAMEHFSGFPNRFSQFLGYAVVLNLFLIVFSVVNRRFERVLDSKRVSQGHQLSKYESHY